MSLTHFCALVPPLGMFCKLGRLEHIRSVEGSWPKVVWTRPSSPTGIPFLMISPIVLPSLSLCREM